MREILKMYILYFFGDSVMYLLIDSFKESIAGRDNMMTHKIYISFPLIAALAVVSIIADRVWVKITRKFRSSQSCLITMAVVILILSAIADYVLMVIALHFMRDLCMTKLDCILLAVFCPITSIIILVDIPD